MAAKMAKIGKANRGTAAKSIVSMRDKKGLSWKVIADSKGIAPRTARRLYDSVCGEGAHHGLLPGRGGRQVAA